MSLSTFIFFDCMETLIDLKKLPKLKDYAAWSFFGSGAEGHWKDFDDYFFYYKTAREMLSNDLSEHKEYEILERFELLVKLKFPGIEEKSLLSISQSLYKNFWDTYSSLCYVKEDVREVVGQLAKTFRLGVVSNYMVQEGIERLLTQNNLIQHFDFVVTSVAEGWRKPHPSIYRAALTMADAAAESIVFIGDDFINDYVTPRKLGMHSILLDRYGRHKEITDRIEDFYGINDQIKVPGT